MFQSSAQKNAERKKRWHACALMAAVGLGGIFSASAAEPDATMLPNGLKPLPLVFDAGFIPVYPFDRRFNWFAFEHEYCLYQQVVPKENSQERVCLRYGTAQQYLDQRFPGQGLKFRESEYRCPFNHGAGKPKDGCVRTVVLHFSLPPKP